MNVRALLFIALAAAGCASPREHYYSLMPDLRPAAPVAAAPLRAVSVAGVTVPEAVDRPQLVIGSGAQQRMLLEQERWVEPVAEDLQRALAQHLSTRLADTLVLIGGERGADAAAFQVVVQVRRLEMSQDSGARLDAHWLILGKGSQPLHEEDFSVSVPAGARGYPALVRAQSAAVGSLAAQIAAVLQGLPVTPAAVR